MFSKPPSCTKTRSFLTKTSIRLCRTSRKSSRSTATLTQTLRCRMSYKKCRTMNFCSRQEMALSRRRWRKRWLKICQWACSRCEVSSRTIGGPTKTRTHTRTICRHAIWQCPAATRRWSNRSPCQVIHLGTTKCTWRWVHVRELLPSKTSVKRAKLGSQTNSRAPTLSRSSLKTGPSMNPLSTSFPGSHSTMRSSHRRSSYTELRWVPLLTSMRRHKDFIKIQATSIRFHINNRANFILKGRWTTLLGITIWTMIRNAPKWVRRVSTSTSITRTNSIT